MKLFTRLIFLCVLSILFSCAAAEKSVQHSNFSQQTTSRKSRLTSYNDAVENLGNRLALWLNSQITMPGRNDERFYIFNSDVVKGVETELSRRFIQDIGMVLINKNINIVRKDAATWDRATGQAEGVNCKEVLRSLATNYLIEFKIETCPSMDDCLEARVNVLTRESNDVLFIAKEKFLNSGTVARWYLMKSSLPKIKGNLESPYRNFREAASRMAGKLCCIIKEIAADIDGIKIVVGKTQNTPEEIALAFSDTVSQCGLQQIIGNNKWLPVAISSGDQFELGIYRQTYREQFETANLVLAIDIKDSGAGKINLKAKVLALNSIDIKNNKKIKTIRPGVVIPYCSTEGYAEKTFRIINSKKNGIQTKTFSHASSNNSVTKKGVKKKNSLHYYRTSKPGNIHAKAAAQRAQINTQRNIKRYIQDRLKWEAGVIPSVLELIKISGTTDRPDCRVENHYLSPKGVPARHICEMNYDLKLMMNDRELFFCQGRIRGTGSNKNTAWEQAITGLGEKLYELVRDIALTASERMTLADFTNTLNELDGNLWQFSQTVDVNAVLELIKRQIEDLEG